MRIGPHSLATNLFLSPLAGYTNLPLRLTVRELGGLGWATTDLVNARSLLERNPRAFKLVATCAGGQAARDPALRRRAGGDARCRGAARRSGARRSTSTWAAR
jgi:tRNA-dihydrouridine synthase